MESTVEYGEGDEYTNNDGAFKMTKSGNPPPMTYIETPDPSKVEELKRALTEEEVSNPHPFLRILNQASPNPHPTLT